LVFLVQLSLVVFVVVLLDVVVRVLWEQDHVAVDVS
jgi:hypothetical protein